MSTFYDDGGVNFAQEQFDKARDRRDKEAKKQEKFAKRLQIANMAITGANLALNNKADKLETEGLLAREHYLSANQNALDFNKEYNDYVNQGYEMKDIFELQTLEKLNGYITEKYGEGYQSDAVKKIARDYISNQENFEAYRKMVEAYQKIPGLNREEMIDLIKAEEMPPRNIAEFFGNKLKKISMSHDENTLGQEDKLAKQRKLGGLIGIDFDNLKTAITEFGDVGNPIDELVDYIKDNPDKALLYKDAEQSTIQVPTRDSYGNERLVTKIISSAIGANKQPILLGEVVVGEAEKKASIKPINNADIPIIAQEIESIIDSVSSGDEKQHIKLRWEEVSKRNNESLKLGATKNIMHTMAELKRTYNMNHSMALPLATEFVLSQEDGVNGQIDTVMSQFDIDKIRKQVNAREFSMYIEDINKNNENPYNRKMKILNMRNDIVDAINKSENMDIDSKTRELIALDSIMVENGFSTIEEENQRKIDNANIPKEEKEFLEEVNEQSVFMKSMKSVIYGPDGELDGLEIATLLIPGWGLYKGLRFGGTLAMNAFMKTATKKIISDPRTAKFIAKAKKFLNPNQKGREAFINNLTPTQKVIFDNINKNGNIVNLTKFSNDIALMKGTYLMGQLARVKTPLLYGAGGGLFIYARTRGDEQPNQD